MPRNARAPSVLRCNPFGEPPSDVLPLLVVADLDADFEWWRAGRRALQWTGDQGRGKSAHLAAIRGRAPEIPWVYLPEDEARPPIPAGRELILDEAQRLPRPSRWWHFRRLERIAVGTHVDLRGELEAARFEVRAREADGHATPARLTEILERRLTWAESEPGAAPRPSSAVVRRLVERWGDDRRGLLDELYESFQAWIAGRVGDPWEAGAQPRESRGVENGTVAARPASSGGGPPKRSLPGRRRATDGEV